MIDRHVDVAIAGGGLAGATLGGVLARSGLDVVVFERERQFRDRIRGEFTWPWGRVALEKLGLLPIFESIGALPLERMDEYLDGSYSRSIEVAPQPGLTFRHAALQTALLDWAASMGAAVVRPARVATFQAAAMPQISVVHASGSETIAARLVVAATGKASGARSWTGGTSVADPVHHWFGGVAIEGADFPKGSLLLGQHAPEQALLFHLGHGAARLYLRTYDDVLDSTSIARSIDEMLGYVKRWFDPPILENARRAGPLGFFPNSNTWASKLTAPGLALIGDVAGSADPSGGHGTSLVFRDVLTLSDLLLTSDNWLDVLDAYERERRTYFEVIHARDRWYGEVAAGRGPEGEALRRRQAQARELDPTLGGFGAIEFFGPDGLIPDNAHRDIYFGAHIDLEDSALSN